MSERLPPSGTINFLLADSTWSDLTRPRGAHPLPPPRPPPRPARLITPAVPLEARCWEFGEGSRACCRRSRRLLTPPCLARAGRTVRSAASLAGQPLKLPFLAISLPFDQRLMPLLAVLPYLGRGGQPLQRAAAACHRGRAAVDALQVTERPTAATRHCCSCELIGGPMPPQHARRGPGWVCNLPGVLHNPHSHAQPCTQTGYGRVQPRSSAGGRRGVRRR